MLLFQLLLNMNFSSRTTSLDVQRNLEANVEKRTKDTYGPPPGKRLLIFVDDMNMPQVPSLCVSARSQICSKILHFLTNHDGLLHD